MRIEDFKVFNSAPSSRFFRPSGKKDDIAIDTLIIAKGLLAIDYKDFSKDRLLDYFIELEKSKILMSAGNPWAFKFIPLLKDRMDEIDNLLMNASTETTIENDVSEQTDHGIIFN